MNPCAAHTSVQGGDGLVGGGLVARVTRGGPGYGAGVRLRLHRTQCGSCG